MLLVGSLSFDIQRTVVESAKFGVEEEARRAPTRTANFTKIWLRNLWKLQKIVNFVFAFKPGHKCKSYSFKWPNGPNSLRPHLLISRWSPPTSWSSLPRIPHLYPISSCSKTKQVPAPFGEWVLVMGCDRGCLKMTKQWIYSSSSVYHNTLPRRNNLPTPLPQAKVMTTAPTISYAEVDLSLHRNTHYVVTQPGSFCF